MHFALFIFHSGWPPSLPIGALQPVRIVIVLANAFRRLEVSWHLMPTAVRRAGPNGLVDFRITYKTDIWLQTAKVYSVTRAGVTGRDGALTSHVDG